MAFNSNQTSSHEPRWIYDVFLSFRGEDTRKKFTDHLYAALKRKGIFTFRDDEKLERGKEIAPSLLKAIEESRFSVIVLSVNYATSSWCLDELVHILDCKELYGLTVLPVFYNVNVSDVREQAGSIGEAFAKHEKNFKDNEGRVQKWRAAFVEVANHSRRFVSDGSDARVIKDIVEEISRSLREVSQSVAKDLVGMDSRVQEMKQLLPSFGADGVCFIGICGMEGIGKTTIARAVYDEISAKFEGSGFLDNVREALKRRDLVSLQERLLSQTLMAKNMKVWDVDTGKKIIEDRLQHKKILLVLDDVDQIEQLQSLAGNCDWFGAGSRIIITTRDENLLSRHGIDRIYKPQLLNQDESLKLFCKKAFHQDHSPENYAALSKSVVNYAEGLPLALQVMGSFLFKRSIPEWNSALGRLRKGPDGWKRLK